MRYKYNDPYLNLQLAYIMKIPIMYTDLRIERESLPEGLYCYSIRHDDEGHGVPCLIENNVFVNHYGDIISKEPIENKLDLSDEDFSLADENISLEEFLSCNKNI